jgi:hypothetical protein
MSTEDIDQLHSLRNGPTKLAYKSASESANDRTTSSRRFSGWRLRVFQALIAVGIVLCINIITLIVVPTVNGRDGGVTTLFSGNCRKTKLLNSGIHVLINIFSTTLLAGSNYCMQVLSAPSREELDSAHNQRVYLDIGVPSIRNLREIPRKRIILWALLGLSSIPLHLFYNSVVFAQLGVVQFTQYTVQESFITGAPIYPSYEYMGGGNGTEVEAKLQMYQQDIPSLQNLSMHDCIKAYSAELTTDRSDVLVVVDTIDPNRSLLDYQNVFDQALVRWIYAKAILLTNSQ